MGDLSKERGLLPPLVPLSKRRVTPAGGINPSELAPEVCAQTPLYPYASAVMARDLQRGQRSTPKVSSCFTFPPWTQHQTEPWFGVSAWSPAVVPAAPQNPVAFQGSSYSTLAVGFRKEFVSLELGFFLSSCCVFTKACRLFEEVFNHVGVCLVFSMGQHLLGIYFASVTRDGAG